MWRFFLSAIACGLLICSHAAGDRLIFHNGDQLTGKLIELVDGKLVFDWELGGRITVPADRIKTLSTEAPVEVHLRDGTVLQRLLTDSESNHVQLTAAARDTGPQVRLVDIVAINPPSQSKPAWSGDVSLGLTSTHGNSRTDAFNASVNLQKRRARDRTALGADYARGRQQNPDTGRKETTEDWWRAKAKYDYFLTERFYGYLDGRYEIDQIAELDRRVITGLGGGYQWIESETMNFSTELGLAWLYEKFDNRTNSNSEFSLQAGYRFDSKIARALKFIHELTYYPSTRDSADYFLTSTGELRASLPGTMFTNLKVILNYDATPAAGAHKTDLKYIWGLGWSF